MSEIVTLEKAREHRLARYFTGKPCKRGHVEERNTSDRCCVACNRENSRRLYKSASRQKWLADTRAARLERQAKWLAEHPDRERILAEKRRRRAENREEIIAKQRERYRNNRAKVLRQNRVRKYGLLPEQFEALKAFQSSKCAICKSLIDDSAAVDHCHKTGEVRGLLCRRCNTGLGGFCDSPKKLRDAIAYLERGANRLAIAAQHPIPFNSELN